MNACHLDLTQIQRLSAELEEAVLGSDPAAALQLYLSEYDAFSAKVLHEWRLASALLEAPHRQGFSYPYSWPEDMNTRSSGGALIFVASQMAGVDIAPPPILLDQPALMPGGRRLLACAWSLRPTCGCLADGAIRKRFCTWLASEPAAIGMLLLAAARCGDDSLLDRLRPLWWHRGILEADAATVIAAALRHESIAGVALQSLPSVLARINGDSTALLNLVEAGFGYAIESFNGDEGVERRTIETTLDYSRLLLARALDDEQQRRVLVLRLGALGALGTFDDGAAEILAEDYGSLWQPRDWVFPRPDWLLYALQRVYAKEQEQHLLSTGSFEQVPEWVLLARRAALSADSPALLSNDWHRLYQCEPNDERVLIGLSRSLRQSADEPLREEARGRWLSLLSVPGYESLAAAFLVLLNSEAHDLIKAFERYLIDRPLDNGYARLAARDYVRALGALGHWDKVRGFLDGAQAEALTGVTRFLERSFIDTLSDTVRLPHDEDTASTWLARWERLLALPLDMTMLTSALRQFLDRHQALGDGPEGRAIRDTPVYRDLRLQLLRRAQAEAERRLGAKDAGRASSHPDAATWLLELRNGADLPQTLSILSRLAIEDQRKTYGI